MLEHLALLPSITTHKVRPADDSWAQNAAYFRRGSGEYVDIRQGRGQTREVRHVSDNM